VNEFDLEGMEEALHGSVVVTAACPAHGRRRLHVDELFAIGLGGVLIGRKHGFVRRFTVTSAAAHDGAQLANVLDATSTASDVWAYTAYRSKPI
jgi:hypothetical protein